MAERLFRIQKVAGSIPVSSMKYVFVLTLVVVVPTCCECEVPQVMGMYVISGGILTCLILCVTTIWRWGIMEWCGALESRTIVFVEGVHQKSVRCESMFKGCAPNNNSDSDSKQKYYTLDEDRTHDLGFIRPTL